MKESGGECLLVAERRRNGEGTFVAASLTLKDDFSLGGDGKRMRVCWRVQRQPTEGEKVGVPHSSYKKEHAMSSEVDNEMSKKRK